MKVIAENLMIKTKYADLLKEVGELVYQVCKSDSISLSAAWIDVTEQTYNDAGLYPEYGRRILYTSDQLATAILKATKPLEDEIVKWREASRVKHLEAIDWAGKHQAISYQLAAAQGEIEASSKDSLRLLESVKYLRGIAEHGEERQQREDETVEQFVLGYVKKLEDQLAKAEQRVAELIPGNGKELSERMKRLATNSVWRYSADQNKPVDMSDPNIQELFAIIDHLCIGINSPANGASS